MEVFTTSYLSPLGLLQIRCNHTGITTVSFAADDPLHQTHHAHPLLGLCVAQLDEYFSGSRVNFSLPLAQTGTTFQQKVWQLLRNIPYGKTVSYQTLSKQYGDVKAIRAIASANGKNTVAIIVPCHRVIGSDQSLTGYAGGLWRKQWLLEHEAKWAAGVQTLF